MAVYQSGTYPIIREKTVREIVPHFSLNVLPHVQKRMIKQRFGVPRKAKHHYEETDFGTVHVFTWYEVETNA